MQKQYKTIKIPNLCDMIFLFLVLCNQNIKFRLYKMKKQTQAIHVTYERRDAYDSLSVPV